MKFYRSLTKFADRTSNRAISGILLGLLAFYFSFKKITGVSVSDTLDGIFHTHWATYVSYAGLLGVLYCGFIQLVNQLGELYPSIPWKKASFEPISLNVYRINQEIDRHCEDIRGDLDKAHLKFTDGHHFLDNLGMVVQMLTQHCGHTLKKFKGDSDDYVFVSVYYADGFKQSSPSTSKCVLRYLTHYPHGSNHKPRTAEIDTSHTSFKNYFCTQAINDGKEIVAWCDCSNFAEGTSDRKKTLKHYVGFVLRTHGVVVGYVNLEFHSRSIFESQADLVEYSRTHLHIYYDLIRYQFLKAVFFETVKTHLIKK